MLVARHPSTLEPGLELGMDAEEVLGPGPQRPILQIVGLGKGIYRAARGLDTVFSEPEKRVRLPGVLALAIPRICR